MEHRLPSYLLTGCCLYIGKRLILVKAGYTQIRIFLLYVDFHISLFFSPKYAVILLSNSDSFATYYSTLVCILFLFQFIFFLFFSWLHHTACWILVPWLGIRPMPPAVGVWSLPLETGLPAKSLFSSLCFISFPGLIVLAAASVPCWLAVLLVVIPTGDRPPVSSQ